MGQYSNAESDIRRREMIARALQESGNLSPSLTTRSSGAYVVPISPWEKLNAMASSLLGGYMQHSASTKEKELNDLRQSDATKALGGLKDAIAPSDRPMSAAGSAQVQNPVTGQNENFDFREEEQNPRRKFLELALQGADPEQAVAALRGPVMSAAMPLPPDNKKYELNAGSKLVDATGKVVAEGNAKTAAQLAEDRALINVQDGKGGYRTIKRSDFKDGDKLYEKPTSAQINLMAGGGLSADARTNAAERFRQTGQLPPRLTPKERVDIMNEAANLAKLQGDNASEASLRQQTNKAAQAALGQLSKQEALVGSFEKTAMNSLKMATDLSSKVDRSNTPVFNRWIVAGKKSLTNDADVAKFHAATETFTNEYAKIMSGSMGNTPASDSSREHARELFSTAQTNDQYQAVAQLLVQEMEGRTRSFVSQRAELMDTLRGGSAPAEEPAPATAPAPAPAAPKSFPPVNAKGWKLQVDAQGNHAYVGPNNEVEEVQ